MRIENDVYTIIGEFAPSLAGPAGVEVDDSVFISLEALERRLGSKQVFSITAQIQEEIYYLDAMEEIERYFARSEPEMTVRVISPVEIIQQIERQLGLMALLVGAIGAIALTVGGFAVMNVMLVAVTERRREVGIRRALGARRREIQLHFLMESGLLCFIGGVIGVVLGIGVTLVICYFAGWTWQFSALAVLLGLCTSCIVGLFFGIYPARLAANLDPIRAIRE